MSEYLAGYPLWVAKIAAAVIFLAVLAAIWALPRSFIMRGAPDAKRWRDLRIWAAALTAVQLLLYWIF